MTRRAFTYFEQFLKIKPDTKNDAIFCMRKSTGQKSLCVCLAWTEELQIKRERR